MERDPGNSTRLLAQYAVLLVALFVGLLVAHIVTWRSSASRRVREFAAATLHRLELESEPEQRRVLEELDRVLVPFQRRELEDEQVRRLLAEFEKSPLALALRVLAIEAEFRRSELPESEKQLARDKIRALFAATLAGTVPRVDVEPVLDRQPPGPDPTLPALTPRPPPVDSELRSLLGEIDGLLEGQGRSETAPETLAASLEAEIARLASITDH